LSAAIPGEDASDYEAYRKVNRAKLRQSCLNTSWQQVMLPLVEPWHDTNKNPSISIPLRGHHKGRPLSTFAPDGIALIFHLACRFYVAASTLPGYTHRLQTGPEWTRAELRRRVDNVAGISASTPGFECDGKTTTIGTIVLISRQGGNLRTSRDRGELAKLGSMCC